MNMGLLFRSLESTVLDTNNPLLTLTLYKTGSMIEDVVNLIHSIPDPHNTNHRRGNSGVAAAKRAKLKRKRAKK